MKRRGKKFNIDEWHTAYHSDGTKCEFDGDSYACYHDRFKNILKCVKEDEPEESR